LTSVVTNAGGGGTTAAAAAALRAAFSLRAAAGAAPPADAAGAGTFTATTFPLLSFTALSAMERKDGSYTGAKLTPETSYIGRQRKLMPEYVARLEGERAGWSRCVAVASRCSARRRTPTRPRATLRFPAALCRVCFRRRAAARSRRSPASTARWRRASSTATATSWQTFSSLRRSRARWVGFPLSPRAPLPSRPPAAKKKEPAHSAGWRRSCAHSARPARRARRRRC